MPDKLLQRPRVSFPVVDRLPGRRENFLGRLILPGTAGSLVPILTAGQNVALVVEKAPYAFCHAWLQNNKKVVVNASG